MRNGCNNSLSFGHSIFLNNVEINCFMDIFFRREILKYFIRNVQNFKFIDLAWFFFTNHNRFFGWYSPYLWDYLYLLGGGSYIVVSLLCFKII